MQENEVCCECGKPIEGEVFTVETYHYCEDCFNEEYTICSSCNDIVTMASSVSSSSTGEDYCQDCYNDLFEICVSCYGEINRDDVYWYEDEPYCEQCFNEYFVTCAECGEAICTDDAIYDDGSGYCYCSDCWQNARSVNINSYDYKQEPIFHKQVYENTVYLGVELEFEDADLETIQDFKDEFSGLDFYLKEDGSLSKSGCEIVTHPHTLKAYRQEFKWYKMIKWLRDHGCTSYDNGDCGLHIHTNKNNLSHNEIAKILFFFANNKNVLVDFSRRTEDQINEWCSMITYENAMNFLFHESSLTDSRYSAVNLQNDHTIEFRIFRGTLLYKRFLATLQFVDCLILFVKNVSIGYMVNKGNSWRYFIKFAKRYGYTHLYKYCKNNYLL